MRYIDKQKGPMQLIRWSHFRPSETFPSVTVESFLVNQSTESQSSEILRHPQQRGRTASRRNGGPCTRELALSMQY
jgi:hypothetical protein